MSNEALVEEYQKGNEESLNELIQANEKLVYFLANRYHRMCRLSFLDKDDLIQEGFIGLMEAAKKFDLNRESGSEDESVKFSSYASKAIMGRIFRAANKHVAREKKSDTYSEIINVNSIHDFIPGSEDITYKDLLSEEADQAKSIPEFERKFDNEILKKDLLQLLDNVFGKEFQVNLIDPVLIPSSQALLDKIKDRITPKEIILLHYGLLGKKLSYRAIENRANISVTRLQQIESKAIQTIRTSEHLNPIIDLYGEEFEISSESWNKERMDAISFDGVEKQMFYVEKLLDSIFT